MQKLNRTLYQETAAKVLDMEMSRKVRDSKRISDLEEQNKAFRADLVEFAKRTLKQEAEFEKRILALEQGNAPNCLKPGEKKAKNSPSK